MRMIFIFIDGFGLGENDEKKNPITAGKAPNITYILENYTVMPTDASLGVPGLPQSATGQTAIFTGVNAPQILNRHLSGQPTETLINIINENNMFKELLSRGLKVTNSNVYRQEYLNQMLDPANRRQRPSVTSVMTLSGGLKFRTVEDYNCKSGIYHDITGQILLESGYDVEVISPETAASRLYEISRDYDFTLYEHFMTDIIGHTMDMELATKEIELIDKFLGELVKLVNLNEDIIAITSDHGNIEDLSVKTHTMNGVPTLFIGNIPQGISLKVDTLLDIMPTVLKLFDSRENKNAY